MKKIALLLVIIGALNWLLIGVFGWDIVAAIFGGDPTPATSMFSRIIYSIVGLAGIYSIRFLFDDQVTADNDNH
ncbi:DUF378 domain-containing protein [Thermoactinomyces sp. DSM 45892]|uniref:DUF378 domain-containing protein n=1 Tax=Thermoactinomyces sp. DSM 45892 TaxID=1882753 RepID=UPI0008987333|nr:DUF378 domain-containing protein [Thermoactinomyces sp. DSM 45892]SDY70389.1 hypothetical protein SAMN05444416_107123 [Thermoactinomyces sp. DSM 45892]